MCNLLIIEGNDSALKKECINYLKSNNINSIYVDLLNNLLGELIFWLKENNQIDIALNLLDEFIEMIIKKYKNNYLIITNAYLIFYSVCDEKHWKNNKYVKQSILIADKNEITEDEVGFYDYHLNKFFLKRMQEIRDVFELEAIENINDFKRSVSKMVLTKIGEGKSKIIYESCNSIVLKYKGDVRCSTQPEVFDNKIAKIRAKTTIAIFNYLKSVGISVCDCKLYDETQNTIIMEKTTPIKLEFIPRFYAAGSVVKRFGFEEGYKFKDLILKIDYKTDSEDYLITDQLIIEKNILNNIQLNDAKKLATQVANELNRLFKNKGLILWDFKLELGIDASGNIKLIDEISFDGMRLKDEYGNSYDKDVYRNTGNLEKTLKAYEKAYNMVFGELK